MNMSVLSINGRWANYFTLALLAFIASFLFLPTSKMVNNIFYGLVALPSLLVVILRAKQIRYPNALELAWVILLVIYFVGGALSGDWQYLKHILYVTLFLIAVGLLHIHQLVPII